VGQRLTARIRDDLFRHALALSLRFHDRTPVGKLLTRLTSDVDALAEVFGSGAVGVLADLVTLVVIGVTMVTIEPRLGALLLAIGDGGNPPIELEGQPIRTQAQNPLSALGKVLRLNADGSPARGTPFTAKPGTLPGLWSLGHRNIQGLALDQRTGRVWASEHGARDGDELNRIEAGVNYGWPRVTHSREYFGPPIAPATSAPGLRDPVLVWTPAIAPSGLAVYDGDRYPGWRGDLFAGGLVSRQVHRLRLDPEGSVTPQQEIPIGARVRDVRQGPDGFLYVLTDGAGDGQLLRLEPIGAP
jgi:glucose/arabinose dehydrogenase